MDTSKPQLSLFMAVPTIYSRLLDVYATFDESKQTLAREACQKFRLMVSGSGASLPFDSAVFRLKLISLNAVRFFFPAPLPTTLKAAWKNVGGGVLLERCESFLGHRVRDGELD